MLASARSDREAALDRRRVLKGVAASTAAIGLPRIGHANALTGAQAQRVRPGDPGWPTDAEWADLAARLGGRLEAVTSPLAECRAGDGDCADLVKNLENPYYIQDQAWATQTSGWVDGWQTSHPSYVAIPRDAQDVAAAVTFAREKNLRLVVKGGAHSYLGQSTAPDSLMIWTRDLDSIEMHDAFVPAGCAGRVDPVPAVSVASGAKFYQLYDAVTTKGGRYVQGGGCVTVGVGGHFQTGGFGSFSKCGGLGAGAILEAQIVTANGEILVVNACSHPDLFWALKGGGAGFGITTRLTVKTHELPDEAGAYRLTVKASGDDGFRAFLGALVATTEDAVINPHWGEQVTVSPDNSVSFAMVHQGLSAAQARRAWQPLLGWIARHPGHIHSVDGPHVSVKPLRDWWNFDDLRSRSPDAIIVDDRPGAPPGHFWWAGNAMEVSLYFSGYDSIWLPHDLLRPERQADLADALFRASRHYSVALHFNKGLAGASEARRDEARTASIHPDAVDAFALAIVADGQPRRFEGLSGHEPDLDLARRQRTAISAATAALRSVAPDAGSYSSEMAYGADEWQARAWGPHYARLLDIKRRYDPTGLFTGHHQVGSEMWSEDGFTRLR